MFLLSNVVYQLFFAPRHTHELDPEKGPQVDLSPELDLSSELEPVEGVPNASQGSSGGPLPEDLPVPKHDDANAIETIDDDDDDIIDELEHEEYPDTHRPPRKRHFSLSRTLTGASTASWWTRVKNVLDPHTSSEDLEAYIPHYRYLPIISGVIIPFSILLEIPGLTEDWYIRTENDVVVEIKKNTVILDTGLAFSIAFAALANVCLVVRFMEKRIKTMTILCVAFLTIHDVINIITVTVFGVEHRFDDGFTYGQAFWMTVCSTSVSTFTNVTLIADFIRTPDFSRSGSGLTRKQRTLVISVMVLLAYIAFGSLVQTFLISLTFLDALYFTVVSIETVGFGDIVPITTGARIFTCLYSVFGIINLALTVGLTRETVLEGIEVGYRKRVKAVRQRRRAAKFERRVVRRWNAAIAWRLRQAGLPVWVHDKPGRDHEHELVHRCRVRVCRLLWLWTRQESRLHFGHAVRRTHPRGMHLNLESLSWVQLETAAMETGVPLHRLLPEGFQPRGQTVRESEIAFVGGRLESNAANWAHEDQIKEDKGKGKEAHNPRRFHPPPMIPGSNPLPLTHSRLGSMILMLGNVALAVDDGSFVKAPKTSSDAVKGKNKPEPLRITAADSGPPTETRSVAEQYEALRSTMVDEERRAFWVRFWLVWFVFLCFWMVGSAIFMTTEKWTMGEALYFCVISFTTIGYGDLTPVTPAGRSVYIFWALLGIATMTILISILSEAYSSRYKSIFASNLVTQTVKRYQQRARDVAHQRRRSQSIPITIVPAQGPDTGTTYVQPFSPVTASTLAPPIPLNEALSDSQKKVAGHLEALPAQVLQHARTFGEEVQYLIEQDVAITQGQDGVPEGLKKLMDDVAGMEKLGEKIKEEILGDPDARHVSIDSAMINALLALSIENVLRKIIEIAEEAIEAVKERDRLTELQTADTSPQSRPKMEEAGGVRYRPGFSHGDAA
ncbi:hypothetical protein H0H87_010395 [Tephrocybe sp. NHM501043]|nr:hypothetical protein H0H87_010395 [Tephrocybe sp. NHM501043]